MTAWDRGIERAVAARAVGLTEIQQLIWRLEDEGMDDSNPTLAAARNAFNRLAEAEDKDKEEVQRARTA